MPALPAVPRGGDLMPAIDALVKINRAALEMILRLLVTGG